MRVIAGEQRSRMSARAAGGDVPNELVIFPPGWGGASRAAAGEGPWFIDETAARAVIDNFRQLGRDLVIDYEHATIFPEERGAGGTAPAAGWIKALRWEPRRGLVATVEWTGKAAELIRNHEYRYFSPVFTKDVKTKRVGALLHIALTNDPATLNIKPIAARQRRMRPGCAVGVGECRDLTTTRTGVERMQVTGTSTEGLAGVISALNDTAKSVEIETFTADQLAPILGELSDGGRDVLLALAGALDWQPAAEGAAARRGLTAGRHSY